MSAIKPTDRLVGFEIEFVPPPWGVAALSGFWIAHSVFIRKGWFGRRKLVRGPVTTGMSRDSLIGIVKRRLTKGDFTPDVDLGPTFVRIDELQ